MSAVPLPAANRNAEQLLEALRPDIIQAVSAACRHYGVDQREIEDFLNEIILLLIENDYHGLHSFHSESSAKTWLTAIALHYVSNHVSRQRKAKSLDEISADLLVFNASQENELISKERKGELREAIGRLTRREQQLFELLCRNDLTSLDIATQMGIKVDSVYRRKHALIRRLRGIVNSPGRRLCGRRTKKRRPKDK